MSGGRRYPVPWVTRWIAPSSAPAATAAPPLALSFPVWMVSDEQGRIPESIPQNVGGDVTGAVAYAVRLPGDLVAFVPR